MTLFVPAYDTENHGGLIGGEQVPSCLEACRAITAVHRRRGVPATFFIVGSLLEKHAAEFKALLDDPLFEVASHTWSHRLIKDHPICGKGAPPEQVRDEVRRSKEIVERVFGRPCIGFRTAVGFQNGLCGDRDILAMISEAGYSYVSSRLWGPDYSLPAPLAQASTYADDGYPRLREFPGHGWHENLLKGHNRIWGMKESRILLFPSLYPEAVPPGFVKTPEEEFRYNSRVFIDRAVADRLAYVSLIWHPWSLYWFDPAMTMLDMTFDHAASCGMAFSTFAHLNANLNDAAGQHPPPNP